MYTYVVWVIKGGISVFGWFKKLWAVELVRYLFAGGTAFVFDKLVVTPLCNHFLPALTWRGLDVRNLLAVMAGFLVGLLINNLISMYLVFTAESQKKKGRSARAALVFSVVGVIGLFLSLGGNQLCIWLFGEGETKEWIYNIVIAVPVTAWNYIGRRLFVGKG